MHLTLSSAMLYLHATVNQLLRLRHPLCGALLLIVVCGAPRIANADCAFTGGTTAPTLAFNAGSINLTIGAQPSTTTPIWNSAVITPPGNASVSCNGNTNSGITQSIAGPPTGGDNTLFPTNVPGISYRLKHVATTSYNLASYPNTPIPAGNYNVTGTTQLFLYYTGPYLPPNGGTINGALSQWNFDVQTCTGQWWNQTCTTTAQPLEFFTISANIVINVPTCNVGTSANGGPSNFTFTLPSVTTAQLAVNPTPGLTQVNLPLINCPTGQKVFITLNTSAPYTTGGVNGVIAPSGAGYAAGVGVQLLQANSTTPVTFGTTFGGAAIGGTGITTGSNFTVNLFARYYKTAASVTAGPVQGVATYTLNYQ